MISRTTVSPPTPESNTPIGASFTTGNSSLCAKALKRLGDECINKGKRVHPFIGPEHGVHADAGKAGEGVDLVKDNLIGILFQEKVYAGKAVAVHRLKNPDSVIPHFIQHPFRKCRVYICP